MDLRVSFSLNPTPHFLNIRPPHSLKFNHRLKKSRDSPISASCEARQNLNSHCNHAFPFPPFLVLFPLLQDIRDFAVSGRRKCIFPLRDSVEKCVSCFRALGEAQNFSNGAEGECLQSGGIGMALLSTTTMAKVRISPFLATLSANPTFVSGLVAWFLAQSAKLLLNFFIEKKWDFRILVSSGGMPSSHSALCTALTTSVALCHGVADSLFPVCLGFTLIVMYDATGVRRHAGMQAKVLNVIVEDLFKGHPISQRKLKELLGHTPSQVIAGAFLGVLVACYCCQGFIVAV